MNQNISPTSILDPDACWQAVLLRDTTQDGRFYTAVRSTRIYCRPSCGARQPRRENVEFYPSPEDAEAAGYRACLRCRPRELMPRAAEEAAQRALVEQICRAIEDSSGAIPTLADLASQFHIGTFHLQRTFKRWTGISPHQYGEVCRQRRLREELRGGGSVTEALYAAGYGSSSSLYETAAGQLGMTPGRYRRGGEQAVVRYTAVPCQLGWLQVAATEQGICSVKLGDDPAALAAELAEEFPASQLQTDDARLAEWVAAVLPAVDGQPIPMDLPLDIRGTAFQWKVWETLRRIPAGSTHTYSQVAEAIGQPSAARAVARACATNPVALVIPCHRVVRTGGALGGYRWGLSRKSAILNSEKEKV